MQIVESFGDDELATVFVARLADGSFVEMVESVQPPVPREQKWVLIVSTLKGCPIGCRFCDAGVDYHGRLSKREILDQIDYLISRRYSRRRVPVPKLKIQLARMGEPALNPAVLEVLRGLPTFLDAPGLMPCISTVAPSSARSFMEELIAIKNALYPRGRFQLQFSLHSSCQVERERLIPARIWTLLQISEYGRRFFVPGDRKVTLNFAVSRTAPIDPRQIAAQFSPEVFLIKLTPINPTRAASRSRLEGLIDPDNTCAGEALAEHFRALGFETIMSIGETRENEIGSNCGMMRRRVQNRWAKASPHSNSKRDLPT